MRILWVSNVILSDFAKDHGLPYAVVGGWVEGSYARIKEERNHRSEDADERLITLAVCFPVPQNLKECKVVKDSVTFYGFGEDPEAPEEYDPSLEDRFRRILADFEPDIVHIFGTEYAHTLAAVRAFDNPDRTLIGISGVCSEIADVYMADLPYSVQRARSFRDIVRKDSLKDQQKKFRKRAKLEREALRKTAHITGRTLFDRNATNKINPDAVYHPMNETLRSVFYEGTWYPSEVERFSIFMSQGDYPLKGLHFMLQAMPSILEQFPKAHLYVAGNSLIGDFGGKKVSSSKYPLAVRITAYGQYLRRLIRQLHLEKHVTMLGRLSAEEMKERYLKSHVYVCPSVLENSPNSLCEAMLLGVPVVAAKVGGIPDFVSDGEDGILFPSGRYRELVEGVKTYFYDIGLGEMLGARAKRKAQIIHNPDTNYLRLLEIYRSMLSTRPSGK